MTDSAAPKPNDGPRRRAGRVVIVAAPVAPAHRGTPQEGYEMLLARYTWTATGDPLTLDQARVEFGKQVQAWTRPGWFWCPATPRSAETIRAVGHRAVGTVVTTWIPPQSAPVLKDVPEPEGDLRAVVPGAVTPVAAVPGQVDDHDGLCPVCSRAAAVRAGHLQRHPDATGLDCAGAGWPGPPPEGAPTYGRTVEHLVEGELFTIDGLRWYCAAVALFGSVAVYISADRNPDTAPTVRIDADRDATVRVWRRPRVLLGHDPDDSHSLRHVPHGTPGAVELVWVGSRYVQVCRRCGAHDCGDHDGDPAVVRAYHQGLTT
jgi:hypothetical protein